MQNLTAADSQKPQRDFSPLITFGNYLVMAVALLLVGLRLLDIRQQRAFTLSDAFATFLCIIPYLFFFANRTVIRKAVQEGILSEKGEKLCYFLFRNLLVMTSLAILGVLRLR